MGQTATERQCSHYTFYGPPMSMRTNVANLSNFGAMDNDMILILTSNNSSVHVLRTGFTS